MNSKELDLVKQAAVRQLELFLQVGDLRRLNKRQRELLLEASKVLPKLYAELREQAGTVHSPGSGSGYQPRLSGFEPAAPPRRP